MYLHKDKQFFEEVVSATANEVGLPFATIENIVNPERIIVLLPGEEYVLS